MDESLSSKLVTIFVIVIMILSVISEMEIDLSEVIPNPNDYARITDIDYKAVLVDEPTGGGKVVITERLTFDIHAASSNNLFWELWRDLPEDTVDGLKIDYKVNSVKQIFEDGTYEIYEESPKLYWEDSDYTSSLYGYGPGKWYHSPGPYNEYSRQYECVFFYVDGLYREEVVFEIEYEMNNAALRYNDVSELYLSLYSEDSIKYLESLKGQILIPTMDMPNRGNYEAYTYGTNSHTFPFTESDTLNPGYHTFAFELNEEDLKFKAYNQYVEFSLLSFGTDKHIFTNYAPNNYYSNSDALEELGNAQKEYVAIPKEAKKNKTIVLVICCGISLLLILYTLTRDKKMRKKYNFYKPTTEMIYYRDIPSDLDPYFAASLVFAKHKTKKDEGNDYSAIMLSLVRKDYIELAKIDNQKDWKTNNIKILIKYKPAPPVQQTFGTINQTQKSAPQPRMSEEQIDNLLDLLNMTQIEDEAEVESKTEILNKQLGEQKVGSVQAHVSQPVLTTPQTNGLSQITQQKTTPVVNQSIPTVQPEIQTQQVVKQTIEYKKYEPLTITEEQYFNLIVRHANGNEIAMSTFQNKVSSDYANTDSFVKNVENSVLNIGIGQGHFQKANYKEPKEQMRTTAKTFIVLAIISLAINLIIYHTRLDFAFGGFFILGGTFIICAIYLYIISKKYILFTQFGEDEYAKWRGLYDFLNSMTLMNERTVVELPLWEKYLVYATAFGISEKVIKALEIRCPEMDISTSTVLNNPYYRSTNYRTSSRTFRTSTRHASHSYRTRSYSSGRSYYGGGGRGGGGGGGGH